MNSSKTLFSRSGDTTFITNSVATNLVPTLPAKVYQLQHHPEQGFFLKDFPGMSPAAKRYGRIDEIAGRIANTYKIKGSNTGVLLSGDKGSGKTETVRVMCQHMLDADIPVIVIDQQFYGSGFVSFMAAITQSCMIVFDEFEKVYTDDVAKTCILGLMDGLVASNKLFVITVNSPYKMSEYMLNRPGRLLYRIDYDRIDQAAIREYCAAKLNDTNQTESVVDVSELVEAFSFDMLVALVAEMNRYNEGARQAISWLNIRPGWSQVEHTIYTVKVIPLEGTLNPETHKVAYITFQGHNPTRVNSPEYTAEISFWVYPIDAKPPEGSPSIQSYNVDEVEGAEHIELPLQLADCIKHIGKDRTSVFRKDGYEVVVSSPTPRKKTNMFDLI